MAEVTRRTQSPLRIVHIIEACGAGVGRHVLDLAGRQATAGHEVTVIYSPARAEQAFLDELHAGAYVAEPASMRRSIGLHDVADAWRIRRAVRRHHPQVVHGHSSKGGLLSRLASLGSGTVSIYTPHAFAAMDPTAGTRRRWLFATAERLLARATDVVVCVSPEELRFARGLNIDEARLCLVPNGTPARASIDRLAVRTSLGVGARDVVLGFVGRLSSQKAPDVLVRAFARITPVAPHVHLVVAGDGPMRDGLVRLTGSLGLADAVTFLGHVDASSLMQAFDVMVIPSRYEGLPYVALEALNAGLPIIATAAAGCELVVQPGVNGRVVPVDDPVALADAIIPYTTDSRLRRAASCASLQRAPAFSLETMVESTLAVYDRALDERAPGHRRRRSS